MNFSIEQYCNLCMWLWHGAKTDLLLICIINLLILIINEHERMKSKSLGKEIFRLNILEFDRSRIFYRKWYKLH